MDVKLVSALLLVEATGPTNVEVEAPVAVYVGRCHAGRPPASGLNSCGLSHLLETEVASIQVEVVRSHVGRKVEVRPAVSSKIASGHAPAVVEVVIINHIQPGPLFEVVAERDPRGVGGKLLKQRRLRVGRARLAGTDEKGKTQKRRSPAHVHQTFGHANKKRGGPPVGGPPLSTSDEMRTFVDYSASHHTRVTMSFGDCPGGASRLSFRETSSR